MKFFLQKSYEAWRHKVWHFHSYRVTSLANFSEVWMYVGSYTFVC